MKKPGIFKKAWAVFAAMHLSDRLLLIFMIILMVQSGRNLFYHELSMQSGNVLDVVVRTTAAGIFGYFISANFQSSAPTNGAADAVGGNSVEFSGFDGGAKAKIGFTADSKDSIEPKVGVGRAERRSDVQIIIVAAIGLLSLLLLVVARNYFPDSGMAIATVSQLRDFVSGSVGFLIGHSAQHRVPVRRPPG